MPTKVPTNLPTGASITSATTLPASDASTVEFGEQERILTTATLITATRSVTSCPCQERKVSELSEVSSCTAINIRYAKCLGRFDSETSTMESALGDATSSVVGDTTLVDACTTEVKDSPASQLLSIGELDFTEKSFVVIYMGGSAADSENTRPTGLNAASGVVKVAAPVIGNDIHSGITVKSTVGYCVVMVPDKGTSKASPSSTWPTSATTLPAPSTNGTIKGDRSEVPTPVALAVAGSILETSFTTAIVNSLKGVAITVKKKITAKDSNVTQNPGVTNTSRIDKIGMSIRDQTASEKHTYVDGSMDIGKCTSCYVHPNSPPQIGSKNSTDKVTSLYAKESESEHSKDDHCKTDETFPDPICWRTLAAAEDKQGKWQTTIKGVSEETSETRVHVEHDGEACFTIFESKEKLTEMGCQTNSQGTWASVAVQRSHFDKEYSPVTEDEYDTASTGPSVPSDFFKQLVVQVAKQPYEYGAEAKASLGDNDVAAWITVCQAGTDMMHVSIGLESEVTDQVDKQEVAKWIIAPLKSILYQKIETTTSPQEQQNMAGPSGDGTNDVVVSCQLDTGTLADLVADTVKESVDTTSSEKDSTASEDGASEGCKMPGNTIKHTKTIVSLNPGNTPSATVVSVPSFPSLTTLTYSSTQNSSHDPLQIMTFPDCTDVDHSWML